MRHALLLPPVTITMRKSTPAGEQRREWIVTIPMLGPFDWMRYRNHAVLTCAARSPLPAVALPVWTDDEDVAKIRLSVNGRDVPG